MFEGPKRIAAIPDRGVEEGFRKQWRKAGKTASDLAASVDTCLVELFIRAAK
jgi:hypothetical protein